MLDARPKKRVLTEFCSCILSQQKDRLDFEGKKTASNPVCLFFLRASTLYIFVRNDFMCRFVSFRMYKHGRGVSLHLHVFGRSCPLWPSPAKRRAHELGAFCGCLGGKTQSETSQPKNCGGSFCFCLKPGPTRVATKTSPVYPVL